MRTKGEERRGGVGMEGIGYIDCNCMSQHLKSMVIVQNGCCIIKVETVQELCNLVRVDM